MEKCSKGDHCSVFSPKRELQNTNIKKLNQEAKAKNKPTKLHKEIITKLTKLFSPIQITNEDN
jgi:hypothetical protein